MSFRLKDEMIMECKAEVHGWLGRAAEGTTAISGLSEVMVVARGVNNSARVRRSADEQMDRACPAV